MPNHTLHRVLFFSQLAAAITVIIIAIVNLTVPGLATEEEKTYWKVTLSGIIGYLFPSPSFPNKNGFLSNPTQ
jgi:hypothetical protein